MKLRPIIDRLDGLKVKHIAGAAGMADAEQSLSTLPAAFVVPSRERASANNRATGVHDQRITAQFSVILIVPSAGPAANTEDTLDELTEAVKDKLIGWSHPDMSRPTDYTGGQLVAIRPGEVWWGLDFFTAYHVRKTA